VKTSLCQILSHTWTLCEGHSEMIWTCLICSNLVIYRLNAKQLVGHHISLLDYTLLLSPWKLPGCVTELFFGGIAIQFMDSHQCSFFVTGDPIEPNAASRCFLSTICRWAMMNIWWFNAFFPQEPHGPYLPMIIALHFAALGPVPGNDAAAFHRHARLGAFGGGML